MISRIVRSLLASSLILLLVALGCWYFAPPPVSVSPDAESVLRVGARETWLILMGICTVLGLAVGLAGVKFWINDRSERQIANTLLN